jgi:hypothetical protein
MSTPPARHRILRTIAYAIPMLAVLAQEAFMRSGHEEPYPALMMPGFEGTRTAPDGSIGVTAIALAVRFQDGTTQPLPLRSLLDPMPSATMMTASGWALGCDAPVATETRRWLRTRLETLYPARPATSIDVGWFNDTYRVDTGVLRRAAHVQTGQCTIDVTT